MYKELSNNNVKISKISKISNISLYHISLFQKQCAETVRFFLKGLPFCLFIPLYNLLIHPTKINAVFSGGALLTFFTGGLFVTQNATDAFVGNYVSFYGLTLGFFGGYKLVLSVFEDNLGNVLAAFLITLILAILVSWGLHTEINNVPEEISYTFFALSIGGTIGALTAYAAYYVKVNEEKKNKKKETAILCQTYHNGAKIN
jgi:hypothetical protein